MYSVDAVVRSRSLARPHSPGGWRSIRGAAAMATLTSTLWDRQTWYQLPVGVDKSAR